jgi:molybdate transport system regulatory protein
MAAAARAMGMSYRRAWLLVDEMNKLFATPVVAKWQGGTSKGGASLTDFGATLVASYEALRRKANHANRKLLGELGRAVRTKRSRSARDHA